MENVKKEEVKIDKTERLAEMLSNLTANIETNDQGKFIIPRSFIRSIENIYNPEFTITDPDVMVIRNSPDALAALGKQYGFMLTKHDIRQPIYTC